MDLILSPKIQEKFNLPSVQNISATLPKNPKKAPWKLRNPADIKLIVVHHTASTAPLINQAKYHISAHNWYTLAYHVVIDRGQILQTNDLLSLTSHALGVNDFAIGVCVNWDLRLRGLTQFEHDALIGVILSLKSMFPNAEVMGHNEASWKYAKHRTSCPVISMDKMREDIMSVEQELAYNESEQKKDEIAYRIANQILYLYNMAKGKDANGKDATPGQMDWAKKSLLKLEPEMRRLGFLK